MVKLFIEIVSAGVLLLAADLGGFHIQVEPGEQTETPSGWEEFLPEEEREDISDFSDNTEVVETPVEEDDQWEDSQWEDSQWEGSQWEDSQWEDSTQWEGSQWENDQGKQEGQQKESGEAAMQESNIRITEPDGSEASAEEFFSAGETPVPTPTPMAEATPSPSLSGQEEIPGNLPENDTSYPRLFYWRGETAGASRLYLTMRQTEYTEIFSLRVNGAEVKWHREGMKIVIETGCSPEKNLVELAVFTDSSWTEPENSVILFFK